MRTLFRGSSDTFVLNHGGADCSVGQAFSRVAPGSPNGRLLQVIGSAYHWEQTFPRTTLLQAAEAFQQELDRQRNLLPYHYSYQIGDGQTFGRGSGGASGFRINGKLHSIWSGAGVCYLQEMGIGSDGRGQIVNTIDVRDQKHIETDDYGTIAIYRRKLKLTLFESIPQLVTFLRCSKDDVLRVLTTEGKPSLMDLVRLFAEGGGADDWAGEQLYEMGQAGRDALIEKLGDRKTRKHHPTIAWILLTVFPSLESRQAVEKLLEHEQDAERKAAYLTLLASTAHMPL